MQEDPVLVEAVGSVGVTTLIRPKQMIALNDAPMDALGAAMLALDADEGIGAIVIAGSVKAFAAGADIASITDWMDVALTEALRCTHDMLSVACDAPSGRARDPGHKAVGVQPPEEIR
jgi:enoyl-CoA hydratase/carnithine racemase